ncbi:DUF92 domain-containing protein [Catalinimonas sp. 4WD22]|uniref:DUF92 domain-containing protein n=1 Tax=Catalinimonas locisalis TaxID=3133978 RepID=UPI00310197B1
MDKNHFIIRLLLVVLITIFAILTKKITIRGAIVGGVITLILWTAFGLIGVADIATFFLFGTAASMWKNHDKKRNKLEEKNEGKRDFTNVLGNAGVAGLIATLALIIPELSDLLLAMATASFASALSDTFSSELGNVYGTSFINILSFRKGVRGEDGVISWEGSMYGMLGSLIIALLYFIFQQDMSYTVIIFFSGIFGNLTDSLLGAGLQRKGWLNNHSVNFLSVLLAALFALGCTIYW